MSAQRQAERRTEWLKVRLTSAEHAALVRKAEEAGMTRSALMRDHLGRVTVANREDHRAWVREVARIGSNLNQLARWVNTYKRTAEALPILRALRQIQASVLALRSSQRDGAVFTQARGASSRRAK